MGGESRDDEEQRNGKEERPRNRKEMHQKKKNRGKERSVERRKNAQDAPAAADRLNPALAHPLRDVSSSLLAAASVLLLVVLLLQILYMKTTRHGRRVDTGQHARSATETTGRANAYQRTAMSQQQL
jgi:hypothetical protein